MADGHGLFPALLFALAVAGCGGGDDSLPASDAGDVGPSKRNAPNIVVVMTDDQGIDTMRAMPKTRRLVGGRGVTFDGSVTSFPLCCPSRATFLTGQYAHNHGVLDNGAPAGGLAKLDEDNTLPVWLSRSGYETAFVGKYLNGYGKDELGGEEYVPPGWDQWYGLTADTKKAVFDYEINRNGKVARVAGGEKSYKTDVLSRIAERVIKRQGNADEPLFLWVATSAPHADPQLEGEGRNPAPAPRHRGAFEGEELDAGPAFDERDVSDKPGFVRELPRLESKAKTLIQTTYTSQLESLLAVDDLVANLVRRLRGNGDLRNTIFVFTSDNGFLRGQHRIDSGKAKMYEESIRVPLLVMGPGFPAGVETDNPVANVDLAATFMDAAGVRPPRLQDGVPLGEALGRKGAGRTILLEVFSRKADQFTGIRTKRWAYAEREGDIAELYDLRSDPYELENLAEDTRYSGRVAKLRDWLGELRDCAGADCR